MLKRWVPLSVFSLLLMSGCQTGQVYIPSQSDSPELTSHDSQSVYEVEFFAVQAFFRATIDLNHEFERYCAQGGELLGIKQQWHQTTLAWMALQGQERGPTRALERSWNVQFWPDKKNTTGRKMQSLITSPNSYTVEEIAEQSVTVQGLGAIEWLLYEEVSNLPNDPMVCETGVAISENLVNNADAIRKAWSTNPWKSLDNEDWEAEYLALLSSQLDYSIKKLSRPMAKVGNPRPYFAEAWRSQTSMSNLKANIEALEALYIADGNGLDRLLRDDGHVALADRIVNQFDIMLVTWPSESSLFQLLQSKQGYQQVFAQYNKLTQLKYLIHEEVAIELGVVIGFNATDGD
ncbi:iron-regulated protein A [Vibrio sinensis]|uniref:Iron-regulated protein A n=1 Tax=Vibrio sinensis TaxID=2302434 RepID=A0A3A6QED6_9VIBR|nr:imelysin family protein [Vibrio sinensis]RJX68374.1 iron-regulated protein A [Vibrio sinensis]